MAVAAFLLYSFIEQGAHQDETPDITALWDFKTVESTAIDSTTLLADIHSGKKIDLQVQTYLPDHPPFTPVSWPQNDFLEVAQAYWKAIWQDDPNLWQLYKVDFNTTCDNTSSQFYDAEFFYYQEIKRDGEDLYSVRDVEIYPAYGYLAWGGDTVYPRPKLGGLIKIDSGNLTKISAEKALILADQHGGNDFRKKENNICNITLILWPKEYGRSDWLVLYSGKTSTKIWIPIK